MVFYYLLETWVHKVEKRQKYCLYIVFIYTYLHIQKTFSEFPPPPLCLSYYMIICHYKLWDSCKLCSQPLSLCLTPMPFSLNLDHN